MGSEATADFGSETVGIRSRESSMQAGFATSRSRGISILKPIAQTGHVVLSMALIVFISYLLGRQLLIGVVGNEAPLHIGYISWLQQYFPNVPNWYPLQGNGVALERAYPIISHLITLALSEATALNSIESFRLIGFLSVPGAAIGIYFLTWSVSKSQVVGLIASILFLASPISWWPIYEHGWIGPSIGFVAVPIALLAFIRFAYHSADESKVLSHRLWFVIALFAATLSMLSHPYAGSAALSAIGLYTVFMIIIPDRQSRITRMKYGVRTLAIFAIPLGLLLTFWIVPLASYNAFKSLYGSFALAAGVQELNLEELISLTSPGTQIWAQNASIPLAIIGLSGVALVFAVRYSRGAGAIAFSAWILLLGTQSIAVRSLLETNLSMINFLVKHRAILTGLRLLMPVAAAFGAWALARLVMELPSLLHRIAAKSGRTSNRKPSTIAGLGASLIAVAIAGFALYQLRSISSDGPGYINYGPVRRGFYTGDIWAGPNQHLEDQGDLVDQLDPTAWPQFEINSSASAIDEAKRIASRLPDEPFIRYDSSPYLGQMNQQLALYADASQSGVYFWPSSLLLSNQGGIQANAFFGRQQPDVEFGTPVTLNELANWYGIEYVFLASSYDPSEIYTSAGWKHILDEKYGSTPAELWQYPNAKGLATASNRPAILVLSRSPLGGG